MKHWFMIEDTCLAIVNEGSVQLGICAPNRPSNDAFDRDLQRKTYFDVHDLPKLHPERLIVYGTNNANNCKSTIVLPRCAR